MVVFLGRLDSISRFSVVWILVVVFFGCLNSYGCRVSAVLINMVVFFR